MFEVKGILEFDPVDVSRKHSQQSTWKKVAMVRLHNEDTFRYYKWLLDIYNYLIMLQTIKSDDKENSGNN